MAMLDPLDAGSIRWQGRAVAGEAVPGYRKQVIYLHQRPALLDGSVEDNLRHPFTLKAHRDRRFDRSGSIDLLARLGRDRSFLDKASRDLSGGEAQIVGLVRALQLDPAVLLLDEPTASLDPATAAGRRGAARRLAGRHGPTSGPSSGSATTADQALRMTDRRICLCGRAARIGGAD